ncbi:hypothetical protein BH11MYX2_BH11MYX2_28100 [soil metagenome]
MVINFVRNRATASLLIAALAAAPVAGCTAHNDNPPPAVDDTRGGRMNSPAPNAPSAGMSTKKKVVLLAGAAALYYLYKKHKSAAASDGVDSQYYLSKNGRVYYRDAEHRAHWVTPPPDGIQVPADEAAEYRDYQGYDNSATGHDLVGLGTDPE